jgi:GntR family transcriptional regulator/MocR family aminotransferase
MRRRYAARRTALVQALQQHAPEVELHGLAAGFHAVAQLPTSADEHSIVAAARHRSIGLQGMSSYCMTRTLPAQLVLGFGNLTTDAIHDGISTIADLLQTTSPH